MPLFTVAIWFIAYDNYLAAVAGFRAECRNRELAFNDTLTGLPNRAQLLDRLQRMCLSLDIERLHASEEHFGFAVLCLDQDGFKRINDTHGHSAGDAVLEEVGRRLKQVVRAQDSVRRVGGDEFVILLPQTDRVRADTVARRAIASLSEPIDLNGVVQVQIGVSVGGVIAPEQERVANKLLLHADNALYEAKRAGKGMYFVHPGRAATPNTVRGSVNSARRG